MAIAPINTNIPSQALQNISNQAPHLTNRNSVKQGDNNNAANRAEAASHQQPVEQHVKTNIVRNLETQKIGLNPSNAI